MPEIDARIRELINSRPHFKAEGFVATRILRGFEVRGTQAVKAAWETLQMPGAPAAWPLAERLVADSIYNRFDIDTVVEISAFDGTHDEVMDHIVNGYDLEKDNSPIIFARLPNDETAVYFRWKREFLSSTFLKPVFTVYPHSNPAYVIIRQSISAYVEAIQKD